MFPLSIAKIMPHGEEGLFNDYNPCLSLFLPLPHYNQTRAVQHMRHGRSAGLKNPCSFKLLKGNEGYTVLKREQVKT